MERDVVVEKKNTRAESILGSLNLLVKRSRCLKEEAERVSRLITGDVPANEERKEPEIEKPSNFLAALEDFARELGSVLRDIERNVDNVKEQVSVELFAKATPQPR